MLLVIRWLALSPSSCMQRFARNENFLSLCDDRLLKSPAFVGSFFLVGVLIPGYT